MSYKLALCIMMAMAVSREALSQLSDSRPCENSPAKLSDFPINNGVKRVCHNSESIYVTTYTWPISKNLPFGIAKQHAASIAERNAQANLIIYFEGPSVHIVDKHGVSIVEQGNGASGYSSSQSREIIVNITSRLVKGVDKIYEKYDEHEYTGVYGVSVSSRIAAENFMKGNTAKLNQTTPNDAPRAGKQWLSPEFENK